MFVVEVKNEKFTRQSINSVVTLVVCRQVDVHPHGAEGGGRQDGRDQDQCHQADIRPASVPGKDLESRAWS